MCSTSRYWRRACTLRRSSFTCSSHARTWSSGSPIGRRAVASAEARELPGVAGATGSAARASVGAAHFGFERGDDRHARCEPPSTGSVSDGGARAPARGSGSAPRRSRPRPRLDDLGLGVDSTSTVSGSASSAVSGSASSIGFGLVRARRVSGAASSRVSAPVTAVLRVRGRGGSRRARPRGARGRSARAGHVVSSVSRGLDRQAPTRSENPAEGPWNRGMGRWAYTA